MAEAGCGVSTEIDLTPLIALLAELFPDVNPGPPPPCRECGHPDVHACCLCRSCFDRWAHAGYPEVVPPRQRRPRRGSHYAEFARVRALGATVAQAARHAGIPEYAGWQLEAQRAFHPEELAEYRSGAA
jgi:hypothetical protein